MIIDYIGVKSASLVLGGVFTVLGGVLGILEGIAGMIGLQFELGFIPGLGIGIVEIIVMVIAYAIIGLVIGLVTGAVSAWAFNHSAKLFGGIEIGTKK
jgi:hypothetical protein